MGAKSSTPKLSKDQKKLKSFYTYQVPDDQLITAESKVNKSRYKFFARGLIFGFVFQLIIYNANIYDAINRRATTRRLKAKLKEEEELAALEQAKSMLKGASIQ